MSSSTRGLKAILGNLKHSMIQELLLFLDSQAPPSENQLREAVRRVVEKIITEQKMDAFGVGLSERQARDALNAVSGSMGRWLLDLKRGAAGVKANQSNERLKLLRTCAIEENIWSPILGLKGQVDASVQVQLSQPSPPLLTPLPFEFKSGVNNQNTMSLNRAQVILYTYLLHDRYLSSSSATRPIQNPLLPSRALAPPPGILAYIGEVEMDTHLIQPRSAEVQALFAARNRVASALIKSGRNGTAAIAIDQLNPYLLPPLLLKESSCTRCFSNAECMLYHAAVEGGNAETSGAAGLFSKALANLKEQHLAFFRKWDRLIDLEAEYTSKSSVASWQQAALDREDSTGQCVGGLILEGQQLASLDISADTCVLTFKRGKKEVHGKRDKRLRDLSELSVGVGDRVIISTESIVESVISMPGGGSQRNTWKQKFFRHFNVGSGNVVDVEDVCIKVACTRPIQVPALGQNAIGGTEGSRSEIVYRLDKDSSSINFSFMRENLAKLFLTEPIRDVEQYDQFERRMWRRGAKLRGLIVDLVTPTYAEGLAPAALFGGSGSLLKELEKEFSKLNADQKQAVLKVVSTRDFSLILGMPGTGKTWVLSFIVRLLIARGSSVLISSYTHSAVDTLLLKLHEKRVPFLRLGKRDNVHATIQPYILEEDENLTSIDEVRRRVDEAQVVACTCFGIRNPLFQQKDFDYCLIDEAGQICQPVCYGPLRYAEKFILIGDHNQLPPLVQSPDANQQGMAESLFQRLLQAHPVSVQPLREQYRMNADIMSLSNELFYNNQLRCGSNVVARSHLFFPCPERLRLVYKEDTKGADGAHSEVDKQQDWLKAALSVRPAVIFLDTEKAITGILNESDDANCSKFECQVVELLVAGLIVMGIPPQSIGVISPFRAHVRSLRRALSYLNSVVEMDTIDKFQGKDKECMIMSFGRGKKMDIMKDWRRLNVALSRAKHKLILVGSYGVIKDSDVMKRFLQILARQRWILPLPPTDPLSLYKTEVAQLVHL